MGYELKQLRNKKTGEVIHPETEWDLLKGVPDNLLTADDIDIQPLNTQLPKLGPNVYQVEHFASRVIKLKDFTEYYFSGTFECDKSMFTDDTNWGKPATVVMYLPDSIKTNSWHVQQITARPEGNSTEYAWEFRELWETLTFDGFLRGSGIDPNNFPQKTKLEISGVLTSL